MTSAPDKLGRASPDHSGRTQIGLRLKAIRESDESQRSIASTLGIDQPNFNSFVHGKRSISFETAALLADHLGLVLRPR